MNANSESHTSDSLSQALVHTNMVSWRSVAFGATMFSSSALNNLFVTYYITYFTTVVGISPAGFYIGQTLFMCWNGVNDVVFGWLSDHCCTRKTRRAEALRWGGLVWALAFVCIWLPLDTLFSDILHRLSWNTSVNGDISPQGPSQWRDFLQAIHFLLVLCVYDGGLTFVEVNHSALLAELTSSPSDRAECNMWSGICAGVGALSSWLAYVCWDPTDLTAFRWAAVCVGVIAWLVFEVSSRYLAKCILANADTCEVKTATSTHHTATEGVANDDGNADVMLSPQSAAVAASKRRHHTAASVSTTTTTITAEHDPSTPITSSDVDSKSSDNVNNSNNSSSWMAFFMQLLSRRNFLTLVTISTLQVFDCTFEKNFFTLSLDYLVGSHVTPAVRGFIISSSFILPHACTVIITPIIRRRGLHDALTIVWCVRLCIVLSAVAMGSTVPAVVCVFLLVNRITSESVCRLTPLIVSDMIDEDTWLNKRSVPLSASVAGAVAFIPKFSQSLAPMLGVTLLPSLFQSDLNNPSPQTTSHQSLLWTLLLGVPLACVLVQLGLWRLVYSLKGAYLKRVKLYVSQLSCEQGTVEV